MPNENIRKLLSSPDTFKLGCLALQEYDKEIAIAELRLLCKIDSDSLMDLLDLYKIMAIQEGGGLLNTVSVYKKKENGRHVAVAQQSYLSISDPEVLLNKPLNCNYNEQIKD